MAVSSPTPIARRARPAWLDALVVAAACWPWLGGLHFAPLAADSLKWMTASASTSPDWVRWVFGTQHFVGYRPVTGLSFTLTHLAFGYAPWAHRAVDLALLAWAGLAAAALLRALRPGAPVWVGSLVALLVVGHASVEYVAPFIARRGYSLGTALALSGLALGVARPGWRGGLGAGVLLTAALLAGEALVVAVAVLPCLVFAAREGDERRAARAGATFLPAALLAASALAVRAAVVGGVGGYEDDARWWETSVILASAWRSLAGPGGTAAVGVLLAAAPYYAVRALSGAGRATRLVLAAWLALLPAVLASQHMWFERQGFFLAVPCALLVGVTLADTLAARRERPRARALHFAPQAAVLLVLLAGSPVLRGPEPARRDHWQRWHTLLVEAEAELRSVPPGARVLLVRPWFQVRPETTPEAARVLRDKPEFAQRMVRAPIRWLKLRLSERDLVLREWVWFEGDGARIELSTAAPLRLQVPAGVVHHLRAEPVFERRRADAAVALELGAEAEWATHVLLARYAGAELVPLR